MPFLVVRGNAKGLGEEGFEDNGFSGIVDKPPSIFLVLHPVLIDTVWSRDGKENLV